MGKYGNIAGRWGRKAVLYQMVEDCDASCGIEILGIPNIRLGYKRMQEQ